MVDRCIKPLIDNMPFPVWIKDLNKETKFANNKFNNLCKAISSEKSYKEICSICVLKSVCDNAIDEVIKKQKLVMFELTINNKIKKCYVNPFFDGDKLIGVIGILIDITKRKEEQRRLEEQEHILRTIIDTIPDYIFYKDRDCRYLGYNKKWKEYYENLGLESMIGKTDFESGAVPYDMAKIFVEEDKEIMNNKSMKVSERKVINPEGKVRIEETIKVPVISEDGQVWGIVGLASDVTEKIELKEKLMKLSYTDSLTGVYNRACFDEKKEELNKKEYMPMGVIMGDVNGLKVVNDTFGHLEGDKLLIEITKVIKSVTDKNDFIFRWGGDEFVILAPNCNENRCEKIVNDIVNKCKEAQFNLIEMSISLGFSVKKDINEDINENLKESEEKLYRQKFLKEDKIRSSIIFSLFQSLHERNIETKEHTRRLLKYTIDIGKKLGFNKYQLDELELVTELHDIGKIGISDNILLNRGKLTDEEFRIMKTHTEKGYRILQASNELSHVARSVLTHHERYDGNGYPLGLKEGEIPIMARIVSVVDSYDAMITDNGYNQIKSKKEAIDEIKRCKGKQFDPEIADIFIEILENKK